MALTQNKFLPTMSKEIKDIYDRLPSEDDIITQQRERQQYYSLNQVKEALKTNRGREEAVYRTMADSLTRDKDAMQDLVRLDPRAWKYVHPDLRMDLEMRQTCMTSHNRHMQTLNGMPMYTSQLPEDVLSDPRVIVPVYREAYQGQIKLQAQQVQAEINGQTLNTMNQEGQKLEDRMMTMELVIRAKSNPEIQQALNQVEQEVIRNNKDDVAIVATKDPSIMDAVEARAPEAKKEIETKRQEYENAFLRADAMTKARSNDALEDAAHTEYNVGVTATSQTDATEGIARADNYTQDAIEEVIQDQEDVPRDAQGNIINSLEEEYLQLEETDIDRDNNGNPDALEYSGDPAFMSFDDGHYDDGPTYNIPGMPNF